MEKKKLVVFTGAGVSADSGIATFRDADGLWANYRIEDVCTPEALARNREQVIGFYNMRRRELLASKPNAGHYALAGLEDVFDVRVITQNIDDLHERAGSRQVLHLHGELRKLRSTVDERLVFFGEAVPNFERAAEIAAQADLMIVAGTSLAVYPAASLVRYVPGGVPVYLVDPGEPDVRGLRNLKEHIRMRGAEGLPLLAARLRKEMD